MAESGQMNHALGRDARQQSVERCSIQDVDVLHGDPLGRHAIVQAQPVNLVSCGQQRGGQMAAEKP